MLLGICPDPPSPAAGCRMPGQRVQVNGFDWDAPHRAPRSISWTEQWHFGAGSYNRCGSRSSEHIQKRQRHPPPSKSVNLNSLPWTIEPSPALLGGLGQLENQGERGLVRQAALRAHRAMADRRERALDWVRGP